MKFLKKNNALPFIFSFFNDFLFYYSFYISCFTKHGFTAGNLAILLIIMNASKMFADIPIGLLSDRISRRNILILGLMFRSIFCAICLFGDNFYAFILAMFFVGCGNSCMWTHTWNYFYDFLKEKKEEKNFSVFMGKFYAVSNIAIALAGITGKYIFEKVGFNGVFIGSILSMIIAMIIMLQIPNYKPKKTIRTATNIKVSNPLHFIELFKALLKKPNIIRILSLSILLDSMFIVFLDMNTTIMNTAGFSPEKISQIVGIVAFIRIFSNYFSGKTEKFMSFVKMHSMLLILMFISILLSCLNSSWMILMVSFYLCVYPFFDTSIKTKIEHKLDSNTRATIMGLVSLFVSIFSIILNALIGIIAEKDGYFATPVAVFLMVILIISILRNITKFYRVDIFLRKNLLKVGKKNK